MARLDLPDMQRDEDAQASRRGGITRSEHRDHVETLSLDELRDIAEARFVAAAAIEALLQRGGDVRPGTLTAIASMLRNGLRGNGRRVEHSR